MLKNSHPFLKISSIFYFSYLDDSNKLAQGIGKFGRVATSGIINYIFGSKKYIKNHRVMLTSHLGILSLKKGAQKCGKNSDHSDQYVK